MRKDVEDKLKTYEEGIQKIHQEIRAYNMQKTDEAKTKIVTDVEAELKMVQETQKMVNDEFDKHSTVHAERFFWERMHATFNTLVHDLERIDRQMKDNGK
jgi:uncharacterized protein with HEPN domain